MQVHKEFEVRTKQPMTLRIIRSAQVTFTACQATDFQAEFLTTDFEGRRIQKDHE